MKTAIFRTASKCTQTEQDFPNNPVHPVSHTHPQPVICPAEVTTFILTSSNAVPTLQTLPKHPIVAVGPQTAQAAKNAGYQVIHSGDDNAQSLIEYLNENPAHYAHLCGDTADTTWHNTVKAPLQKLQSYTTTWIEKLPEQAKDAQIILLFSARSATHLGKLYTLNCAKALRTLPAAVCLSSNVAKAAKQAGFSPTYWVTTPTTQNLKELYQTVVK